MMASPPLALPPASAVLSGPSAVPETTTHALVCLHGFGANGDDLVGLAAPLRAALNLPNLGVWCPNAPQPVPEALGAPDGGRQWFSDKGWTFRDRAGIEASGQALWHYVQNIHTSHHIPYARIAVLGFSQGGMQALFSVPHWPESVGALIGHSTMAMWQEELDAKTCQKPPTLLLHGTEDDVIPADQCLLAATGLEQLGFAVRHQLFPGLGHGINPQSLAEVVVFLQNVWGVESF